MFKIWLILSINFVLGIYLPMSGIKNFVLGFSISMVSVSLIGHLLPSAQTTIKTPPQQKIQIELFKTAEAKTSIPNLSLTSSVSKKNISSSSFQIATLHNNTNISTEGIDDDEILSINTDNIIPIELDNTNQDTNTQILNTDENDNLVAMLPEPDFANEDISSPWLVTKGSQFIDNKNLIEKNNLKENLISDKFAQTLKDDEFVSYKVAEKIKQSILFPIPDEILNDENLTPTFIKRKSNTTKPQATKKSSLQKENPKPAPNTDNNKSIITNITSWLKDKPKEDATKEDKPKATKSPLYSSSETTTQTTENNISKPLTKEEKEKDNFVSFYQTLQDTTHEYEKEKIMPSELKLSFRPDRAEISGQTLRWIKVFSEKTKDSNTFLQVNIDASAPIELQKRRLNLLYSIFMNNGVDLDKIDTTFSLTEPNTFIIRILTTD